MVDIPIIFSTIRNWLALGFRNHLSTAWIYDDLWTKVEIYIRTNHLQNSNFTQKGVGPRESEAMDVSPHHPTEATTESKKHPETQQAQVAPKKYTGEIAVFRIPTSNYQHMGVS